MKPFVSTISGGFSERVDSNGKKYIIEENTIVYRKPPPRLKLLFAYEFWEGISMTVVEITPI